MIVAIYNKKQSFQESEPQVSSGDKIEPYMFSRPIALKLNAKLEGTDHASGAVFGGDETEGWKCWKRCGLSFREVLLYI